jgi:hypothetical protein
MTANLKGGLFTMPELGSARDDCHYSVAARLRELNKED